mgnify:CR=1 FL=1
MGNKLILEFKRNKRTVQSLEVPIEMLKELRHHVSYVHKNNDRWYLENTHNDKHKIMGQTKKIRRGTDT